MSRNVARLLHHFVHHSPHKPTAHSLQSRFVSHATHIHIPNHTQVAAHVRLTQLPHRTFSSSHVAQLKHSYAEPRQEGDPAQLFVSPSPELKDEVELLPVEDATLQITRRAAEQLQRISEREKKAEVGLRVRVDSGGCHGYKYTFDLAQGPEPEDYVFQHPDVKPANVFVDAVSLGLMKGSVIDFAKELIGTSFRVEDNPQAKGAGCGCGVSWELKDDAL